MLMFTASPFVPQCVVNHRELLVRAVLLHLITLGLRVDIEVIRKAHIYLGGAKRVILDPMVLILYVIGTCKVVIVGTLNPLNVLHLVEEFTIWSTVIAFSIVQYQCLLGEGVLDFMLPEPPVYS
jgi:hypothetical protein